jgi:hypothetical protein
VVESPLIPRSLLVGELADEAQPTQLRIARPLDTGRPKPHELWPALGMPARSSIELEVVAPLRPTPLAEIAPPARSIDVGFDRGYRGVPNGTMMQPAVPPGLAAAAAAGDDDKAGAKGKGKGKDEAAGTPDGFSKTTPPGPHERKWTAFRIREKAEDDKPA